MLWKTFLAFVKTVEVKLCVDYVLRDFQEWMGSGDGEGFILLSWVLGICVWIGHISLDCLYSEGTRPKGISSAENGNSCCISSPYLSPTCKLWSSHDHTSYSTNGCKLSKTCKTSANLLWIWHCRSEQLQGCPYSYLFSAPKEAANCLKHHFSGNWRCCSLWYIGLRTSFVNRESVSKESVPDVGRML